MILYAPNHATMTPRPYQAEALDALHEHVCSKETNPCVVLPTGAGKSPVMAWAIERWKKDHPPFRACVLAHTKELVRQNADKMHAIWPDADVGVYAAGLKSRDMHNSITFASIDSVFRKGQDFDPFDVVIVDEAHRIPAKGEGKYRQFIADCRLCNPRLRVIGFTATPYRMSTGPICHADHILNEVCYEANVRDLIEQGYLCRLRSKAGEHVDLSGVAKRGGEYITKSLGEAVDCQPIVEAAIASAVAHLEAENRRHVIFFCVDVEHCHHVSEELARHGWRAPVVTGKTPHRTRDKIAARFVAGHMRGLCNVNVYTEGFDATCVDGIVLLRPTNSTGLYSQMVGRGLRIDHGKDDCLVLDYANCIETHGPIDIQPGGKVRIHRCEKCDELFSMAIGACPACGTTVPKKTIERAEADEESERKRRMHETQASNRSIISGEPETFEVDGVRVARHVKPGKPDSLKVTYRCGLSTFNEWVCLDHGGHARKKAAEWWLRRFRKPVPTVEESLQDLFLSANLNAMTETVTVRRNGKYNEVVATGLRAEVVV